MNVSGLPISALVVLTVVLGGQARAQPDAEYKLFDAARTVQHVHGVTAGDPDQELICRVYAAFMVKELNSGTPTGDISIGVVPLGAGVSPPPCASARAAGEITYTGDAMVFMGTKGDFIVMEQADPNGAARFAVLDRRTLQTRYSDSKAATNGLLSIADENGTLHLRFNRAVNGSCSVPKDRQPCWAKIAREANFPRAVAAGPAPLQACAQTYSAASSAIR
jgi:hypothetical protein